MHLTAVLHFRSQAPHLVIAVRNLHSKYHIKRKNVRLVFLIINTPYSSNATYYILPKKIMDLVNRIVHQPTSGTDAHTIAIDFQLYHEPQVFKKHWT